MNAERAHFPVLIHDVLFKRRLDAGKGGQNNC